MVYFPWETPSNFSSSAWSTHWAGKYSSAALMPMFWGAIVTVVLAKGCGIGVAEQRAGMRRKVG